MQKAHRIRLNPDGEQRRYFAQCAGVARFTWNWVLAEYNNALDRGESPKIGDLKKEFNRLRKEETFAPFVAEVQSYAYQYAFQDFQAAISRYHKMRRAGTLVKPKDWKPRKDGKPFGWPRFKSKFRSTPAFGLANNGGISVEGHWAKIQRCPGLVNMAEPLRFDGKIMSGRVSMDATGKWYLAIQVDTDDDDTVEHPVKGPVGVHLGIRQMAITTNDDYYENPRPLERHLRKLAREQRSLKRKQKGSANYEKQRLKVAKLHKRIANIRREAQHKMTHELTAKYAHLRIQQWDIKGMMQEGPFARGLSDVGDYEIRRQLEYKSQWRGGTLDLVDGDVAISQICSACQHRNNVPLSKKTWVCTECGVTHDREENAAINTLNA